MELSSKSQDVINSILSMDDTILNDIEEGNNDEDEISRDSPILHEKTLYDLAHQWSVSDVFESVGCKNIDKAQRLNNKKEHLKSDKNNLSILNDTLREVENPWQDNTLFDELFAQLDPSKMKDDTLQSYTQEVVEKSKNDFKDDPVNIKDKPMKRNSNENGSNETPKKVHYSKNETDNQKSLTSDDTFYGLPNNVKDLFQKVRHISTLYKWQDECLKLDAIKKRKNLIYALPTSGGKTLVAEILMLKELICNKKNAIFILPFVAIVQEKVQTMAPFALELGFLVEEYAASKGSFPPTKRRKKNSIYMCTIEKGLGLINSLIEENRFSEIGIIVVDELHLLGENGGRGAMLEVLLTKILYLNENIHMVGMSATIGNLHEIAEFLRADLYTGNFRPVAIKEYVKCEDNIWLIDLKTKELLTDVKKINYRYSNEAAIIDPDRIGGLVMDVVPTDSCLIFCASRKNCENVALLLTKVLFKSLENFKKDEKQTLLSALKSEEGLCPILQKTIKFGVAYHHSGLTSEERRLLEDAFKSGTLCVICCTSTLAAGVNLPARRVILRSPYVGNQFLNLSRYKQMIGRAGRAGMGTIGESILICKNTELPQVKEVITSKMDDCISTLHMDKDRGLNHLIMSSILLSVATTRLELHQIVKSTLLNVQENHLDINVKKIVDQAIIELLKAGVLKVTRTAVKHKSLKPNISVIFPSQNSSPIKPNTVTTATDKKIVQITNETKLELSHLGRAAMKGCIDMETAYTLYQDLKAAQEHLVLVDQLHLLYLVTPYSTVSQIKPVGSVYYDVVTTLSEIQMKTARLLGINEGSIMRIREGILPQSVEARVVNRFYVTLILNDLWNQRAIFSIADKYQVNRGFIQGLQTSVGSFASSVVRFCQELDEFWVFRDILTMFSKKISYCCPLELEELMDLPFVKMGRARQLFKAGFKTIQSLAKSTPADLQLEIPYLSRKVAKEIIQAAKLLILKKIENLKDETEEILEGINISILSHQS